MKRNENGNRNKIRNKDENTVWRFGTTKPFLHTVLFCFYDGTGIRIFCASSNRKASGTDAQPGYEISVLFKELGKLHQRAKSHGYDLGTACQLEKKITFLSDMKL